MSVVRVIVILLRAFLVRRAVLAAEILALRHQLGVLQRSVGRPRLQKRDRILWIWLSRLWADYRLDCQRSHAIGLADRVFGSHRWKPLYSPML